MLVIEASKRNSVLAFCTLACWDDATNSCIGLLLRRYRQRDTTFKYPRYHVGITVRGQHKWMGLRYRLAQVDWAPHVLSSSGGPITAEWKQIYISHRPPSHRTSDAKQQFEPEFRVLFPKWLEVELRKQGFEPDHPLPTAGTDAHRLSDGGPLALFRFTHRTSGEAFRLQVGQCHGFPWASVSIIARATPPKEGPSPESQLEPDLGSSAHSGQPAVAATMPARAQPVFSCSTYRLGSWVNSTKTFGDPKRRIQLTFTRVADASGTHLLDIRIGGYIWGKLKNNSPERSCGRALHTMSRAAMRLCSRR